MRAVNYKDGRLAYLKSELNITDAQTEAWAGYAQAVKGRVDAMQSRHQSMMEAMEKGSAIERMNARIASMEVMLNAMKAINPAIEKLYAVLTVEQKKQADELIGMDCGAMRAKWQPGIKVLAPANGLEHELLL